jgi:hypothetical protein
MVLESTVYPALMGTTVELSKQGIAEVAESCVAIFLSHYGERP